MTPVCVLIVNFESGARLRRCAASALAQDPPPRRVLVVDNASTDDSLDDLPAGVEVIPRPHNDGYAAALLDGFAASDEAFVFTLNPDTVLEPGCLAAATSALEQDHRAGAVAPWVLRQDDPARIDAAGIGLTSRMGELNLDHGRRVDDLEAAPRTVLGPLGGAALWRRLAVERAGHFDPGFFLYWEDVDMALRLNRAGYECRTVPAARVLHEGSGIVGRHSPTNVFYMVRNQWRCLVGSLPGRVLVSRAGWVALAPVRAACLYAARGRGASALGGLLCGLLLVPGALLSRRRLLRSGSGLKAAARLGALLESADENRRVLKALPSPGGSVPG